MDEQGDLDAIKRLDEEWGVAVRAKDIDRILDLITEDVVFMPANSPSVSGKAAVREIYQDFLAKFSVEQTFHPQEIPVAGDWAFSWGNDMLILTPVSGGPPIQVEGGGMSIMRREPDGSWKFARGINNFSQPPKAPTPEANT